MRCRSHCQCNLLTDPSRVAQLQATAANYITQKYNWDTVVDQTLALYKGGAGRRPWMRMKILLVNKYFYRKGGAETYFFALAEGLKSLGHEVAFFSMKHPNNEPSSLEQVFRI